jgi:hypothetical protein
MATVNVLNLKPADELGERQFVVTVELRSKALGRIGFDLIVEADSIGRAPDVMRQALLALGHDLVDSFGQDGPSRSVEPTTAAHGVDGGVTAQGLSAISAGPGALASRERQR